MAGGRFGCSVAALALCAGFAAAPAAAEPVTYVLDPEHSFVHFEVLHFGTSTSRGRFGPATGSVVLDRATRSGTASIRVATASVDTGLAIFNARLRQPDLLATDEFPEAFFVARSFRFDGDRVAELRGEITLRGISQGLSLRATSFGCRLQQAQEICGGDFEGELLRGDFGMSFGLPLVANRVRLLVQVEGFRR